MEKSKKITKGNNNSNKRFLLMLAKFKSDQLFAEKAKHANNLYAEMTVYLQILLQSYQWLSIY